MYERNSRFICVQLAEPCDEESEAFKAGFRIVADIGKERIRRAAKRIAKEREGNRNLRISIVIDDHKISATESDF